MKKIINKTTKIILGIIIGVTIPFLFANAAFFNTSSGDSATFQAYNFTQLGACSSCWQSSVSADKGDIITFRIYYHNSSNETARNVRVRVNLTGDIFTSRGLSAEVFADNAASTMGSVTINLSSAQILSFRNGSVRWYPDRGTVTGTTRPLLYGQSGAEIVSSSGLNIGDIAPGYEHDGYVTLALNVGGQNQQTGGAPIVSTNSPSNIGQTSATLNGSVNPNGANTTVWFEYGTTQSLGTTVGNQTIGSGNSSQNIVVYLSNLQPNTTYYFRMVAQNSFDTTYGSIISFNTQAQPYYPQSGFAPVAYTNAASNIGLNYATLNGSINPQGYSTNVWFEYGTTQSLGYTAGYQTLGANNYSSNISAYLANLSSNTTYYFRIVAQNAFGTSYGAILSFSTISGESYSPQQTNAPAVHTLQETYVYQNSALINGSVNPNGLLTTAWFEWGRDNNNLTNKSESRAVGSGRDLLNFHAILSGLDSGTTYYYRAAAQNALGTTYGNTIAIRTASVYRVPAPTQKIITQTVAVKTNVSLDLSLDNEEVNAGDDLVLSATFKNDNSYVINDAVLKITLPTEVTYTGASPKPASKENSILTFNLGKIGAKTQGVIIVKISVNSDVKQNSVLIFGGTLDYSDKNTGLESVESYVVARVIEGETLSFTASLLDALKGIFTSSWFYLLLILIAVGISAWYFGRRSVMKASL